MNICKVLLILSCQENITGRKVEGMWVFVVWNVILANVSWFMHVYMCRWFPEILGKVIFTEKSRAIFTNNQSIKITGF